MPDPGEDYQCWSTVADNNGDVDLLIDWHEGQARRTVNNSARSEMAAHAKNRNLNNGSIITTGSPNAQAFLSGLSYVTIPTGLRATLKVGPGLTNTGSMTINMDGVGDVSVKTPSLGELIGSEFLTDRYVDLIYNGTFWIYLYSAGNFAPLNSPVFTGDPQAPTPSDPLDSDNSIATTAWVQNIIFGGEGIILAQQVFSSIGTFLYVPHPAMKSCMIECLGGGGGGGGTNNPNPLYLTFGGGGGSGGYSRKFATATLIGASQSVTVGTFGAGGAAALPGAAGGDTFVGVDFATALCAARGGGGGSGNIISDIALGGVGGAPGTGDITAGGMPGEHGGTSALNISTGNGGSGALGGGGAAGFANPPGAVGANATSYGSGGGGGTANAVGNSAGGSGSGGLVIITEYAGAGVRGPAGPVGPMGPVGPIGPIGPSGPGTGDVLRSGTPTNGQIAQWTDGSHIQGVAASTITSGFAPLASPVFTGNPQAPTPAPGDADTSIATTGFVATAVGTIAGSSGSGDVPTAGRLTFVSATALKFAPYNGRRIQINGTQYNIPSAGIAGLANTGAFVNGVGSSSLAASTTYYVYAFVSGGTVTGDFRTDGNGHMVDTTTNNVGVEVRCSTGTTPDPTRTLIGMVRTNASLQFVDTEVERGVLSWFNRRLLGLRAVTSADSINSSAPYMEAAGSRIQFLLWGGESFPCGMSGSVTNGSASATTKFGLNFDTTTATPDPLGQADTPPAGAGFLLNASLSLVKSALAEGYHFAGINHISPFGANSRVFTGAATYGSSLG